MMSILSLVINRLGNTGSSVFFSLMYSFPSKDLTILNLFIFTAIDIVSCGGRNSLPVHHHIADYIFWPFLIIRYILSHFENTA